MEPNTMHAPSDVKISKRPKFRWVFLFILVVGFVIGGYFILFSKASTTESVMPNPLYGTWVLQQVSSANELNNYKSQITQALDVKGTTGLSVRFPWKSADLNGSETTNTLLDAARKMVDDYNAAHPGANKQLALRFMAGRHVPARVFDAGAKYYLINGSEKVGIPWGSTSTTTYQPNTIWLQEYDKYVGKLAAWSKAHNVHLLHLSWWAQDWAELNHGKEVRAVAGYSQNIWLSGHKEIIDVGVKYADDSLTVEAPLSGYGPLSNGQSAALADYIISKVGQNSSKFYIQANGWNETQEWGAPDMTTENQFREIWNKPIKRGLQMIQPYGYDWAKVYQRPVAVNATYVEVYLPSFTQTNAQNNSAEKIAALKTQVTAFCSYCTNTTPDTTPPTTAITAPKADTTVTGNVSVSATASENSGGSGLDKIDLYVDNQLKSSVTTSPLGYTWNTTAINNGSHAVMVKAYDKAGNVSSATNNVTVNNQDTTPPSAPTGLTATAVSSSQVDLSWTASTDDKAVTSYQVSRGSTIIATNVTTTKYSDTEVSANTSYTYTVIALDGAGNKSPASNSATVKTPAPPANAPKVPTGLKAAPTNQAADLTWTANSETDIQQYGIRYRKSGDTAWTWLAYSTTTSYEVTKLPDGMAPVNGITYEFSIRARNTAGLVSGWSDQSGTTASAKPMPNPPSNLSISSVLSGSQTKTYVSWDAAADSKPGDYYQLTIGSTTYNTSTTTYTVSGLKKCTQYTATVKSIDALGNASSSITKSFTTQGKKFLWWCF